MKGTRKLAWGASLFALVLVVAATIGGSASAQPTAAAANSTTYQDSTGENPSAPDIGTVGVSNDDTGLVSIAVHFLNRGVLGPTEYVFVDIDSDANATTGNPPLGFDYGIEVGGGRSSLWRFDPNQQTYVIAPMSTLRTDWASSTLTIHVNTSELGGSSTFVFGVVADANPDDPSASWDVAPDHLPLWMYQVKLAPALSIAGLDVTPQPAMAGKSMTAKATVTVTRGGKPETLAANAAVAWRATVGGTELKATGTQVDGGVLGATWALSPTLTDKSVQVTVTVTQEGVTATKNVTVPLAHPAPALRVTEIGCAPDPAMAGRTLAGRAKVVMTRGGVAVALPATAKVTWNLTAGDVRIRPLSSRAAPTGVLTSTWKLPKTIKTKVLRVTLSITVEGVTATKLHLHRVNVK